LGVSLVGGVLATNTPRAVEAQAVRGTVVRSDGVTPAIGAVALLIGATRDSALARAVTSSRGAFLLRAPRAGSYRVRVLRLGQAPTTSGPFDLAEGQAVPLRMVLVDRPLVLARLDVRGKDDCRVRPDSGLLVAQLLSEARTALLASVSASLDGERISEYQRFARLEDTRGRLVAPAETLTVNTLAAQPFASLPPDSLARAGYVMAAGDSIQYFGPDAEVLLSDAFAAGHCFQVVDGTGERAASVGVAFRPVTSRRGVVDIRGTLWLDRATAALQVVEYTYDPIPDDERRAGVGGDVHFARTDGGFWFVSRWNIRMPRVAARRNILGPRATASRTVRVVEGVRRTGGEVVAMFVNDQLAYRRPVSAVAVAPTPGITAGVVGISPDSIDRTTHSICGPIGAASDSGVVQGRVTSNGTSGVGGATVVARWRDVEDVIGGSLVTYRNHQREALSVADGHYVLCGVPLGHPVTVFATQQNKRSRLYEQRIPVDAPVWSLDLLSETVVATAPVAMAPTTSLRVRVSRDGGAAVAEAEVTVAVAGADQVARTDTSGVARFAGLSPGAAELRVRRLGFGEGTVRATLRAGENELAVAVRGANVTLETVKVVAARDVPTRLADVDARIARGEPSAVVTRADIDKRNPITLSQMLRGVAGLRLADSSGAMVAISTRGVKLQREGLFVPCVLRVMVDGVVTSSSVDIDNVVPYDVYAVEVFFGGARIPPQFGGIRTDQWCGLIAIWTRSSG
jgi:Carboxypeptidase regulatory-like domain/TonB-dependent Receptor Plug Domain